MAVFINEFHYDNQGGDTGEFIEIAGTAGTSLAGYSLVLYNGATTGGTAMKVYSTTPLTGTIDDEGGTGFGAVSFGYPADGIQNGSPDAIALVGPGNTVIQFISYEGSFTAADGPAAGMTSVDVGVAETGTALGTSIALTGASPNFTWTLAADDTPGAINTGQSFGAAPTFSVSDATVTEGDSGTAALSFTVTRSSGTGTASVGYATANGTAEAGSDYAAASGTLTFAAGETSRTVTVQVTGDTAVEADETVTLTLATPSAGYAIGDGTATGTIVNDDAAAPAAGPFINEFHYEDAGTDTGEFIEIAGAAGTSLAGWTLALYNGNPSQLNVYSTISLSGTIDNEGGTGYGALSFAASGIQNGNATATEPDGIALVRPDGTVAEFISYEGSLTPTTGPAAGLTSVNVGVNEGDATPDGASISRVGTGTSPADFTWAVTADDTPGAVNNGQSFGAGTPAAPAVSVTDLTFSEGNAGTKTVEFTVVRNGGDGAFTVDYATANGTATAGSDYVATSGTLSFAAGQNEAKVAVTINGDTVAEPNETFFLNLSAPTGGATITDAQGQATIINDELPPPTLIHDIQGSAFFSPILAAEGIAAFNTASATLVTVQAVVTAIDDDGSSQGFFLAEEASQWDSNPLTSEGILVMTRNDAGVGQTFAAAAPGVTVGETVTVSAYVMEYQAFSSQARTVLVNPTIITQSNDIVGLPTLVLDGTPGKAIPNAILTDDVPNYFNSSDTPTDTFDPQNDALDFFETIEGMHVTIPDMYVADGFVGLSGGEAYFKAYSAVHADADQINSRGGYTIAGDPPLSPPDTAEGEDRTNAGGRYLHDGDSNPDIVELDFTGAGIGGSAAIANRLTMGDGLGDVSGVVDFDFTELKLFVTAPITLTDSQPERETLTLADDARSLRVATFNVENLDPGDGAARFQALASAIATNLDAPDILTIEEIQDNNGEAAGGVDANITWQMLTDAVNLATGKRYQWVDQVPANNAEGGAPNGNIRVGFLYNTDRVQLGDLAADASLADRRQFTDRIGDGVRDAGDRIAFDDSAIADQINAADYTSTRKSLLGQFSFNGNDVFVVANHLPSKGGSGEFWQLDQNVEAGTPANAGWEKRSEIADDVYRMMNTITQGDGDARIVAGGDFNDFYFYRPLEVATGYVNPDGTARAGGARFDNLTLTLPEAERFTYDFDGRSQAIDHILVDQALGAVSSYDVVHINTGYNGLTGAVDPSLSDHDPAVAQFDFRSLAERLAGDAGANALEGFGGNDTLVGNAGNDSLTGGAGNDRLDGGADADVAFFSGNRADYLVTRNTDGSVTVTDTVADRDGSDTLVSVEQAGFADTSVAADQLTVGVSKAGGSARDTITGTNVDDKLYGYGNNDSLSGLGGNDSLWGGQGNDTIDAGLGNDRVHAGGGDDSVIGGLGADILVGGTGNDRLEGGADADVFYFGRGDGRDTVLDYQAGVDAIHLASGVSATSAVGDYNGDGQSDVLLTLTGGGQVTILGISSYAQLTVLTNQPLPISDIG